LPRILRQGARGDRWPEDQLETLAALVQELVEKGDVAQLARETVEEVEQRRPGSRQVDGQHRRVVAPGDGEGAGRPVDIRGPAAGPAPSDATGGGDHERPL